MPAYGIEHEVALLDAAGRFVDWTTATYADLDRVIAALPRFERDYPALHVGDAGIRVKRWYLEGIERFDPQGRLAGFAPKGIEIRTSVRPTIRAAVAELRSSFRMLRTVAQGFGYTPVLTSFNPFQTQFVYQPPLNAYELQVHQEEPDYQTETTAMLTYGPDLNFSLDGLSAAEVIAIGQKLTYYSPFIVPFSFSAPFYAGAPWPGLSVRTFLRSGLRPAVRVYLHDAADLLASTPPLTVLARTPGEAGRIEFKACDSCDSFGLYGALLALLKGLAYDTTLPGRATQPDTVLHQQAARHGFADPALVAGTSRLLSAAEQALAADPDRALLASLWRRLEHQECLARTLAARYRASGALLAVLRTTYPRQQG